MLSWIVAGAKTDCDSSVTYKIDLKLPFRGMKLR